MPIVNEGGVKKFGGVSPAGWVRIALYVVMIAVLLAAWLSPSLGFEWLRPSLIEFGSVLAILSGGTAVLNVPQADDQKVNLRELLPSVVRTLDEVRELRNASATAVEVADEVEHRIRPAVVAESPQRHAGTGLPVYDAQSSRPVE